LGHRYRQACPLDAAQGTTDTRFVAEMEHDILKNGLAARLLFDEKLP
jgi:hypothetical protein